MQALVIGAGVSGLSTAILLQQAGYDVRIWTAALPAATTSSVAAAIWYPYRAYPEDRVLGWGARTFTQLAQLADDPATGVTMREGIELWRAPMPDPWWRSAVPLFRRPRPDELPPAYRDGYVFTVPIIEMPIYLRYVQARFEAGGGRIELRALQSLDEACAASRLVVDCAGLGARDLLDDATVHPIRGQIVRVRNPGLPRFIMDEEHPDGVTYIVPRSADCILGGTSQDHLWNLTPDPPTAEAILRRCVELEPLLEGAEILEHKVGLRPGRPVIRLEREQRPDGVTLIHNYGHGGAGVTLSWGCAAEVVELARTLT